MYKELLNWINKMTTISTNKMILKKWILTGQPGIVVGRLASLS